ncbi:MAG: histidine phosphatase family protein [Defluviitaleaceae bacterium]|nr:histidine phosphatase family protein [Defluviitaleaceae bacterium]
MKIYAARHGQTGWNLLGRMQGHTDIPLDETGIAQAEKLAERFRDIPIGKIYSSDLGRALETARTINKHHDVEIVVEEDLREISYGEFEGRLLSEIGGRFAELRDAGKGAPGGEELEDFLARVHRCMDKIAAENDGDILIVGHGGTVRAIECYFLNIPKENITKFGLGNTAVYCFERRGGAQGYNMIIENDTSHLEGSE